VLVTNPTPARPGRNEPCACGSGRKYKQCCLPKDEARDAAARAKVAAAPPAPPADAATPARRRAPKHQTEQPWKTATTRGFVPRSRTPRKVGGG
jgi:SEC-C motif